LVVEGRELNVKEGSNPTLIAEKSQRGIGVGSVPKKVKKISLPERMNNACVGGVDGKVLKLSMGGKSPASRRYRQVTCAFY